MPPAGSEPGHGPGGAAVEPFALPVLGTSWLDRGFGYGVRRGVLALCTLLFVALVGATGTALYLGFVSVLPAGARVVVHVLEGAAAVVALAAGWVGQRRAGTVAVSSEEAAAGRRAAGGSAARGFGNRGLAVLLSPVLPALVAYILGRSLAAVLVRETPREIGARLDYERRLAAAGGGGGVTPDRPARPRPAPRNGPSWR
ncbi:hypothetical protein [Streptomyces sp. IBSBF 2435]|uniref:hypothetical protein n=1 Tax=Streptomyces sp. IBSBF 2435 TaxID=2903531 RepID=UPI002FDC3B3D